MKFAYLGKKRRLHTDILFAFLLFFSGSMLALMFYLYITQADTSLTMAQHLIKEIERDVIEDLHSYLKADSIIALATHLFVNNHVDLHNPQEISHFTENLIRSYPNIVNFYLVDNDDYSILETQVDYAKGIIVKAEEIPADTYYITSVIDKRIPQQTTTIFKNNSFIPLLNKTVAGTPFDPKQQQWYLGALQTKQHYWLHLNVNKKTHALETLTIATSIYDREQHLQGVVAYDVRIAYIENLLAKEKPCPHCLLFLSANHGENLLTTTDSIDSSTLIQQGLNHFNQTHETNFIMHANNAAFITAFQHFPQPIGGDWQVGIILPVDYLVGPLKTALHNSLYFMLSILALGSLIIYLIARGISKPIVKIANHLHRVKQFELDDAFILNTHVTEIQIMLDSLTTMKSGLKSFAKYVPTALVRELIHTGEIANYGCQKRELTLLFSDIANFTSIVETAEPEMISHQLFEYLDSLTTIIKEHSGTIDKYIGDAIMAFWGAPNLDPLHIINACKAILLCKQKLIELNTKWAAANQPQFYTRFGLHTGDMLVGNVGSSDRLNYSVIGDHVNLAARLESINKEYGTQIIVSEAVNKIAHEYFLLRPIDHVIIKGRRHIVTIYELMAEKDTNYAPTPEQEELSELTKEAFADYSAQKWVQALAKYENILKKFPSDGVSQQLIQRCIKQLYRS